MVNWIYVRAMLTLSIIRELHTKSVDFVLAYTWVDVKTGIFLELPIGFGFEGSQSRAWINRLDKNIYGLKDTSLE